MLGCLLQLYQINKNGKIDLNSDKIMMVKKRQNSSKWYKSPKKEKNVPNVRVKDGLKRGKIQTLLFRSFRKSGKFKISFFICSIRGRKFKISFFVCSIRSHQERLPKALYLNFLWGAEEVQELGSKSACATLAKVSPRLLRRQIEEKAQALKLRREENFDSCEVSKSLPINTIIAFWRQKLKAQNI